MVESNDSLKIQNDKEIAKIIDFDNELLMFSDKFQKINRWNNRQERNIVLTTTTIYVFRKKALRKKLYVKELRTIIKSL